MEHISDRVLAIVAVAYLMPVMIIRRKRTVFTMNPLPSMDVIASPNNAMRAPVIN